MTGNWINAVYTKNLQSVEITKWWNIFCSFCLILCWRWLISTRDNASKWWKGSMIVSSFMTTVWVKEKETDWIFCLYLRLKYGFIRMNRLKLSYLHPVFKLELQLVMFSWFSMSALAVLDNNHLFCYELMYHFAASKSSWLLTVKINNLASCSQE